MRLLSCHIEHFGKLSNFNYDFEDGLNIIFEENGWGKSTLAAFLRVMFYGFEGETKRSDIANERSRFRPWGGGTYGGSVTFVCGKDSRRYRVLRTFGLRRKEDSFRLIDDATGLLSGDFSSDLGEELFGIDAESFRRSIFMAQTAQGEGPAPATAAIEARIGGLAGEDADMRQYDAARLSIKKELDRLTPDRATGQISKARRQLSLLQAECTKGPFLASSYREQRAQADNLRRQVDQIQRQREAVAAGAVQKRTNQTENRTQHSIITAPETDAEASRRRLAILRRTEQNILTQGRLEREDYQQLRLERREEEQRLRRRKDALPDPHHRNKFSGRHHKNAMPGQQTRQLIISGFLSLTAGGIILLLTLLSALPVWYLILSVALLCCSAGLFLKSRDLRSHNDEYRASPKHSSAEVCSAETDRSPELSQTVGAADAIHAAQVRNEDYLHQLRTEEARSRERLQALSDKLHDVRCRIQLEKEKYTALHAKSEADNPPASSPCAGEYTALKQQEQRLQSSLIEISRRMQETLEQLRRCRETAEECRSLQEKIRSMEHRYEVCRQTADYLEQARTSFTARYRDPFLRAFRKYYTMLTGNPGDSLQTDSSLSVTVFEEGLPRDPAFLSKGNRDLIALCRRMAMVDAMYPAEKPFLVFDDPFANLDDTRIEGGLRFLQSTSSDYQIFYLTCHASRVPGWEQTH